MVKLAKRIFCPWNKKSSKVGPNLADEDKAAELFRILDNKLQKRPSLFLFHPDNELRLYFQRFVKSNKFEYLMLFFIIGNSI